MRVSVSNQSVQTVYISLRPRPSSSTDSKEVLDGVIAPLLAAVGFRPGAGAFLVPPAGIPQPRADLTGLAQLTAQRYTNSPQVSPNARAVLETLARGATTTATADSALQQVEGQTLRAFQADFDRQEWIYPFMQTVDGVPIEHTALIASRWEGESVNNVSGTLLHYYELANNKPSKDVDPVALGRKALLQVEGMQSSNPVHRGDPPALVLMPYGNTGSGSAALRYAWRMTLEVDFAGLPALFLVWVDGQTGSVLELQALSGAALDATANTWRRDPGTGAVALSTFEIDPATASMLQLKLQGVSARVDYKGDGNGNNDLALSTGIVTGGSADFDRPPLNNRTKAVCSSGGNPEFQQVNFFAALQANRRHALYNGMFAPFPATPWQPRVEASICGAWSTMYFGACEGYRDTACPEYIPSSPPDTPERRYLNFAHDASIIAHEVAHDSIQRLTTTRPANWCGASECPIPIGWFALHDLADVWADHVEDTNCVGGWVAKNIGGIDHSKDCVGPDPTHPQEDRHSEAGLLPRRHELDWMLQPNKPRDHFPEHREVDTDYADMQIAAAILWQLRAGMHSRNTVTGKIVYFARLLRAIKATGMMCAKPERTDRGVYTYLRDLEFQLTNQWQISGASGDASANEVLAAFARGGIFVSPTECIDGQTTTSNAWFCPDGEDGSDAVIDVEDNDTSDDVLIDAVSHIESDFIRLNGPEPTFHVWTGSRFVFGNLGNARPIQGLSPCNSRFAVDVSSDPDFSEGSVISSGWQNVDVDSDVIDGNECHATWTPSPALWDQLEALGPSAIYYRARTTDGSGNRERISTRPGNGFWTFPAPSLRLSVDGTAG
jgi:hypothetical protein